jgi:hypothetical protein
MTKDELKAILDAHAEWARGGSGTRANLRGANLRGADLRGALGFRWVSSMSCGDSYATHEGFAKTWNFTCGCGKPIKFVECGE